METIEAFEKLEIERSRNVRGPDVVFDLAEAATPADRPEGSRNRRRVAAASVAAAVAVVAGTSVYLLSGDGSDPDLVADDTTEATPAAPTNADGPAVVLGVPSPPDGFELSSAVDTGVPSVWTGPNGVLTVFQQLGEDGRVAEKVLAVGVTLPGERTALDAVNAEPDASATEVIGGVEVSLASVVGGTQTISTFGEFDTARWTSDGGSSVVVATRGLDGDAIRAVVTALVADVPAPDLTSRVPAVGQMQPVSVDPIRVPGLPQFASARLSYDSEDGTRLQVGTEMGPWPSAADLLWWSAGSSLTPDGNLLLTSGLTYRQVPGGSATALGPSEQSASNAIKAVVPMTHSEWVSAVGDADESDQSVATTSEAPQGE